MNGEIYTVETKDIIARIVNKAKNAIKEVKEEGKDDFNSGRLLGYFEVLEALKTELIIRDVDLTDTGLDTDIGMMFSEK